MAVPVTANPTSAAGAAGTVTPAPGGTGAATGSQAVNGTATTNSTISIPQTAAAGGILMTMPPQTAQPSFYKIAPSNPITFAWNFTSLYVQPSVLTVSAVCTANGYTYPVGGQNGDGVLPGTATSVVWDPYAYEQSPGALQLAQDTYTLHINDQRGPTAIGTPGMFNAFSGTKFGLYKPGQATPLSQWNCPNCSSGYSMASNPGFISIVVTFTVMMISGFGLLRRGLAAR